MAEKCPVGERTHRRRGEEVCAICRRRAVQSQKRYRLRRDRVGGPMLVPALGTHRRLQALARLGWTFAYMAEQIDPGYCRDTIRQVLSHDRIHRETAAKVAALYERLSGTPGPSQISRNRATRNGWAAPLDWDNIDDPEEVPWTQQQAALEAEEKQTFERTRWERRKARLDADPEYRERWLRQQNEAKRRLRAKRREQGEAA